MIYRYDMLMQQTTAPLMPSVAIPHTGGWSESHWRNDNLPVTHPTISMFFQYRAKLLCQGAAIIGYRIASFTPDANKLLPGPVSTGKLFLPGVINVKQDVPQMALELGVSTGGSNSSRFAIKGIPDINVQGGEYLSVEPFKSNIQTYQNALSANGWCMLGRVLTLPSFRIFSITTLGVATISGNNIAQVNDYVRLNRVKNTNGQPVQGAFHVSAVNGFTVTLDNWNAQNVVGQSGTMRRDEIDIFPITGVAISRVVVRKVGRPFEQYRGRRSKRRKVA